MIDTLCEPIKCHTTTYDTMYTQWLGLVTWCLLVVNLNVSHNLPSDGLGGGYVGSDGGGVGGTVGSGISHPKKDTPFMLVVAAMAKFMNLEEKMTM